MLLRHSSSFFTGRQIFNDFQESSFFLLSSSFFAFDDGAFWRILTHCERFVCLQLRISSFVLFYVCHKVNRCAKDQNQQQQQQQPQPQPQSLFVYKCLFPNYEVNILGHTRGGFFVGSSILLFRICVLVNFAQEKFNCLECQSRTLYVVAAIT